MAPDSSNQPLNMVAQVEEEQSSQFNPAHLLAKHMHGKQEEWDAIAEKKKPLTLLDLPLDIHQAILREVTHTNDLTALALTHSVLHDLVIPQIYSRFDIVWPEANTQVESRVGVDALTYGLATLVMAPDVFGEGGDHPHTPEGQASRQSSRKIRRGNYFAQYTKKFSLGNGPHDWVQDYLITKEGGKMLGTLVALAVGRMRNLETFIWDMPTGVLRDVWLALASLGNRNDGQECRLEKVWVRWHDNTDTSPSISPPIQGFVPSAHGSNIPSILTSSANALFQIPPYPRVEFPTFSILSPLQSLSVLDIDELSYVEEMSLLIKRSLPVLRELRVGLAEHAQYESWALGPNERAVPHLTSSSRWRSRQGGILGILVRPFCNPFVTEDVKEKAELGDPTIQQPNAHNLSTTLSSHSQSHKWDPGQQDSEMHTLSQNMTDHSLDDSTNELTPLNVSKQRGVFDVVGNGRALRPTNRFGDSTHVQGLQLETLELERIHINICIMYNAIDWSRLASLTLLGCRDHELLWKELRKTFTPQSRLRTSSMSARTVSASLNEIFSPHRPSSSSNTPREEYLLKLRRLHTDTVSPALIAFIKDALAPDSLEWLFLQESPTYRSTVTIDTIYKGAVRRHRGSLRKLLIDSDSRRSHHHHHQPHHHHHAGNQQPGGGVGGVNNPDDPSTASSTWKRWLVTRELLSAITSGKMALRELSMAIDYKDWHFFIQRLPKATTLRSLHITHIGEPVAGGAVDAKEAALQILDIVSLRRELELCYLGVRGQCFEVLEYSGGRRGGGAPGGAGLGRGGLGVDNARDLVSHSGLDSDDNEDEDAAAAGHDGVGGDGNPSALHAHDTTDDSDFEVASSMDDASDDDEGGSGDGRGGEVKPQFRLREILFYDDKVSIFRARHGRL